MGRDKHQCFYRNYDYAMLYPVPDTQQKFEFVTLQEKRRNQLFIPTKTIHRTTQFIAKVGCGIK